MTGSANGAGPHAPGALNRLGPEHRAWSVARMATELFDVVVIGGGITGTGAALDASSRGWSVAMIEARDYGVGAPQSISKLIHGGLRYLEMLQFRLVREALRERALLTTTLAPHLVRPVPFIWPLRHRVWSAPTWALACSMTTSAAPTPCPRPATSAGRAALRIAPALRLDSLVGAVQFYDAQTDDARMVVSVARTAASLGAAMATNVRADELVTEAGAWSVSGLTTCCGRFRSRIGARHVVSAAGAWTETSRNGDRPGLHVAGAPLERDPHPRATLPPGHEHRTDKQDREECPYGQTVARLLADRRIPTLSGHTTRPIRWPAARTSTTC